MNTQSACVSNVSPSYSYVLRSIMLELVAFPGSQAPDLLAASAATLAALSREQSCALQ
jgi:hypothetical protein